MASFITGGARVLTNRSVDEVDVYRMAMAQSNKQFGKPINELNPQQYSSLATQYGSKDLAEVKNFMNNPNKAYSAPVGPNPVQGPSPVQGPKLQGRQQYDRPLGPFSQYDRAAGPGGTGPSGPLGPNQATAENVTDSAAPKKGIYDWTMDKLNISDDGRAPISLKGKTLVGGAKEIGGWFTSGSTPDTLKKVGLGAAAWGVGNVAMRGVTGGGVTYNNQGQRDIAGIPFV